MHRFKKIEVKEIRLTKYPLIASTDKEIRLTKYPLIASTDRHLQSFDHISLQFFLIVYNSTSVYDWTLLNGIRKLNLLV